ncbi:4-diphosphocytidyl-2-C-methylerythritol kinase [Rubrivivax sp. A210]|uniref:4-(cytidine 5'-diphospho)-2-C-methyl-D-erythritol kinase n=1 Tax=Rubrivivax sp. A210 TaxID=2772301 RepID=UPI001918DD3C|nr:4-(cytidine 5'-diphospho)-2-C-methyl-D-erythritol kinase [Rubrivivax sp. A210]CAD5372128.1 4-diphosphocytidyl-2-C-methylerythritol kinase [Rubrivivax sp. A210]
MALRTLYDVPAPAKLNLFLHVIGRRADGYHLLQSPFVLIDWADTLHFERRDDGLLARHDLGDPLPQEDLCLRAARALQAISGSTLGADISIAKCVPAGAGMGGGSSDAATTLLALNRLWGLGLPRQRLAEIGLTLGADVPFFIAGHNAFVEGIGERLTPLALPQRDYAVVKPAASLPTAEIFSHPMLRRDTEPAILLGSLDDAGISVLPAEWDAGEGGAFFGRNDLQPPAEDRCPEVAQAAQWLESRYGNSRMTGSGSAVFASVVERNGMSGPPRATFPAGELPPGWVGRLCRSLPLHPLFGWAG